MRAMRRRRDNTLAQRHPVDAYIEKTAHHRTEDEKDHRPEMERNGGPILRVENGVKHAGWRVVSRVSRVLNPKVRSLGS
jgi:hypothetical protein